MNEYAATRTLSVKARKVAQLAEQQTKIDKEVSRQWGDTYSHGPSVWAGQVSCCLSVCRDASLDAKLFSQAVACLNLSLQLRRLSLSFCAAYRLMKPAVEQYGLRHLSCFRVSRRQVIKCFPPYHQSLTASAACDNMCTLWMGTQELQSVKIDLQGSFPFTLLRATDAHGVNKLLVRGHGGSTHEQLLKVRQLAYRRKHGLWQVSRT